MENINNKFEDHFVMIFNSKKKDDFQLDFNMQVFF